jgi:hypothetical protein
MRTTMRLRVMTIATALIACVAMAGTAGAASASPVGGGQGRASVGLAPAAPVGAAHPDAAPKKCFYQIPNCTSANPSVAFRIISNGDTSMCTFQTTTDWGDGKSDSQTYPGGANGATLARFSHTYDKDKPKTWTLTISSATLTGICGSANGTLQFTLLPDLGTAAVRFAPLADQKTNGTPGQPVIKDDGGSFVLDGESGPASCNDVPSPREFDYLDCGTPLPTGSKAKDWPVIYAKGDKLTINQVIFAANGKTPNPVVTATATFVGSGSGTQTLKETALTQKSAGGAGGFELAGDNLTFDGVLPDVPGRDELSIDWTVTDKDSGQEVKTVTTDHVIYMTAGKFAPPAGVPGFDKKPYVTVLYTGIKAASGESGEQAVFNAIWKKFATRDITHAILDGATGVVTAGKTMTYYNNGFTNLSDGFNGDRRGCTALTQMLQTDSGHCGAWAIFLTMVLAFQGIKARTVGIGHEPGFDPGPAPGTGADPYDDAYMLVGRGLWHFSHGTASGPYHFADRLKFAGGKVSITGTEVTYSSTKTIAQGNIKTPPEWFVTGDHAIVEVSLSGSKWVDPSYGNPQGTGYHPDLSAYEKTAIAGFAVVFEKVGKKLVPLGNTYSPDSSQLTDCATHTCFFQAVPF